MLASGVGVVDESIAPYTDSEGGLDAAGDWSLLSRKVRTAEGEAAICPECGCVILEVSGRNF